jgi:uncharacterized membrane protein YkoI
MRWRTFLAMMLLSGVAHAITLADAVEQVRSETGGEILSATTLREDGKRVHRIKVLLPDGRVRIFKVPESNEADAHPVD